jgi:CBS domain containing-hemolysin-like protein
LIWLLRPIFWIGDGIAWLLRGRKGNESASVSWETIKLHLETGRAEGILAEEEEVLIRRISLLNRLTAAELMTPLSKLPLYSEDGDLAGFRDLLLREEARNGFLYRGSPGRIIGLVQARRLLVADDRRLLSHLALPVLQVPAHRPLLDLIDELQLSQSKLAVVTDPRGKARGVVHHDEQLRQHVLFPIPQEDP